MKGTKNMLEVTRNGKRWKLCGEQAESLVQHEAYVEPIMGACRDYKWVDCFSGVKGFEKYKSGHCRISGRLALQIHEARCH